MGDLLTAAEQVGCEMLLTTDRRIRLRRNLNTRRIALVVLTGTKWSLVRLQADRIAAAAASSTPGGYIEVDVPLEPKRR